MGEQNRYILTYLLLLELITITSLDECKLFFILQKYIPQLHHNLSIQINVIKKMHT